MNFTEIEVKYGATIEVPPPSESRIHGISVLLGGAFIAISEYQSTKEVLRGEKEKQQLVIAFNRLSPKVWFVGKTHNEMAEAVRDAVTEVFAEVRKNQDYKDLPDKYSVVGHSMGGKIALLLAAKFDVERVMTVVALDPVDSMPTEIVNRKVDLARAKAKIHLTRAERGGNGSPDGTNADAIKEAYTDVIASYILHRGAGHFAYTDNGGGPPSFPVFPKGDAMSNTAAREDAHRLIKAYIVSDSSPSDLTANTS
jgi:pimeloyl-ACP methyl ester carboxylesterase